MSDVFSKSENEQVISTLNKILELELAGLVRYLHYSFMIFGHNRIPIVGWLRDQAEESKTHATQAGEHITNLGGHPSLKIGSLLETHKHNVDEILAEALAHEEVGLDPDSIAVFGTLPARWLVPSNFAVTPVLAYWQERHPLAASDGEVFRILHEPIDRLLDPGNRFTVVHPSGWRGPAFEVGTPIPLWGFTAGVISLLFRLVGWEKPWDESVTRQLPELR